MKLCRHFDHEKYARKCAAGRIAPADCGICKYYDQQADALIVSDKLREATWNLLIFQHRCNGV